MKITRSTIQALTLDPGVSERIIFDDDLPGFGIRLRAGGARTWVFQYKLGAKHRRMTLGNAKAIAIGDARDIASKLHAKVRLGGDPAGEKSQARLKAAEIFGTIVEQYLVHQEGQLREASLAHVRRHLTTHARPLHALQVDKIARRDIAACISSVKTKSGPISGNRARAALSAFFSWAMGEGPVEHNPVIGTNVSEERPRERVLTPAELALI
jgi:integrase